MFARSELIQPHSIVRSFRGILNDGLGRLTLQISDFGEEELWLVIPEQLKAKFLETSQTIICLLQKLLCREERIEVHLLFE